MGKSVFQSGQKVLSGQKWIYIWDLRDNSAGSDDSFSSKYWFYHSHINEPKDTNSGLVGPIIITKPEMAKSETDLMPKDVDREFVTLFTVFDENLSWYLRHNLKTFAFSSNGSDFSDEELDEFDFEDEDFHESNLMHSMNGMEWNSLSKYMTNIRRGERVRWYIGAMGTEVDIHTAHWHGNIIKKDNALYEDVVQLMPAFTTTVDMFADNPGTWFYHCHVNDHVEAGMIATYTVQNESCTDCVGDNLNEVMHVIFNDDTWIIVATSFIVNMVGFVCMWFMFNRCCHCYRNKAKHRLVKNDELKQSMLHNADISLESLSKKTADFV